MNHAILTGDRLAVVLDWTSGVPAIAHLGDRLDRYTPDAHDPPVPHGGLDHVPVLGLIALEADGFSGRPGLLGRRPDGSGWSPRLVVDGTPLIDSSSASFVLVDTVAELTIDARVSVSATDSVEISVGLTNNGTDEFEVSRLAPSIPIPAHLGELQTFTGRWCLEFQPQRQSMQGLTMVENRRGRTSHDRLPAVFVGDVGFTEQRGEVIGVQLAWSGNFEIGAERLGDGRQHVQAGELLFPGEVILEPGERYEAPAAVVVWSPDGLNQASQSFHRHVRSTLGIADRPRPVILNTWEAVYFDHDIDRLRSLADVASEVGVERFVLDDGWFGSRRDDTSGLGDWWVSPDAWPDGLHPLVDHVTGLGMEFGLWVEPEMVNPDSDLYRNHPEWALVSPGYEPVLGRHQLVLNLGRADVRDYLFRAIDALLTEYDIGYLKWDMNRDLVQAGNHDRPGSHDHVEGLYRLLERIRESHPQVEVESCSSGGGRADLGILGLTKRVWTSDCNDAVDRQSIQRGFSMLFPPEVMGAHIGPPQAHTTARRQPLGFRAVTALFGHLGIEWNLLDADEGGRAKVAAAVALHKRLRPLLHHGDVVRLDHPDPAITTHGVVSLEQDWAVFAYSKAATSGPTTPLPVRFAGLDPAGDYQVRLIADLGSIRNFGRTEPRWVKFIEDGHVLTMSGAELMSVGLQPPVMHPHSTMLVELLSITVRPHALQPLDR